MHFDSRDIRAGMDVYTADGVYLGSVRSVPETSRSSPDGVEQIVGGELPGSEVSGESLGPVSTRHLGNTGPASQSAAMKFATDPDERTILDPGMLEIGTWWGLAGRRTIPLAYVQAVSMDNVVLRMTDRELD